MAKFAASGRVLNQLKEMVEMNAAAEIGSRGQPGYR